MASTLDSYEQFIRVYFKNRELTFSRDSDGVHRMPLPNGKVYEIADTVMRDKYISVGEWLEAETRKLECIMLPEIPDLEIPKQRRY